MSDSVTLLIAGQRFAFWEGVRITRQIDAVDAIEFDAPFEHEAPGFKESFRPFSYHPLVVNVNDDPLFTGTLIDVNPDVSDQAKRISVSGYATCGVLQDCTAPASALPLEFNNLNLREIAQRLCSIFKLNVDFRGDPGAAFGRVACEPDEKIFDFLTDLAKQRGYVMSSNENGDLLFWKSAQSEPVAVLDQGLSPLEGVAPTFNPQEYYSELTGLSPVEVKKPAAKKTVKPKKDKKKDPKAAKAPAAPKIKQPKPPKKYSKFTVVEETEVFRPYSFKIDDIEGADIDTATNAKLARMLGNMATYAIEVSTWRDSFGNLWAPNTKIKVRAPDAMIYDFYDFEVKTVVFEQDDTGQKASLTLALPGSFSGEPPEVFPWEL